MSADGRTTSFALTPELHEWIMRQSLIRDSTASGLMRALVRRAQREAAEGQVLGWPPIAEAPGFKPVTDGTRG